MKAKHLIIILLSFFFSSQVLAQRIVRELESNTDTDMMQGNEYGDEDEKEEKKIQIPTEVHAWVVDDIFGNKTSIHVDTLQHAYQNNSLSEGMRGEYNTLGNLGSPRQNRIFMEREESNNFIFLNPFDQFLIPTNKFRHYDTKSPYMNVSYNTCGSKTTGYDNLQVIYTQNASKRINFGASYRYQYGQGYYNAQNTGHMNTAVWGSYNSDKYVMHMYYQYNFMKMAESGGITDETYITHPENQTISYGSKDIPTYLNQTWNRQEHHIAFLTHHYNIGFERMEGDSTNRVVVFVPVTKFFHTLKLAELSRNFRSYEHPTDYYTNHYLTIGDTINDRTKSFSIRNNLGISLCEGFQKWAAFGLNAYIGHEYRNYVLPDIDKQGYNSGSNAGRYLESENDLIIGGQMIRTMGSLIHYNVDAEYVILGTSLGQLSLTGHGEINIPLFKDTLQIAANAYLKNLNPSFYYRHFHSTYAWWDQDTKKEWKQRIQAVVTYPKTKTTITAGLENIKNYTYFANNGTILEETVGQKVTRTVTNNVAALQCSDNIQVFSITLDQNFAFGPFHLDNNITYQTTSNPEVLPLPKLSTYTNMYLDFKIAKVLKTELGADMKFFTEYYAPDYSPVIGQFTTQNPNNLVKIGKHPLISAYVNFELKRLRFYVQYYHANAGTARAFWGPGYPMNPTGIHFGLSWNFYN